jgi:hypothetical protein
MVFEYVVTPAVKKCGYGTPTRADHDPRPSMITHTIIRHLLEADLVIADLSERNQNCFYELAIRHAVMKPCVHIIEERYFPPPVRRFRHEYSQVQPRGLVESGSRRSATDRYRNSIVLRR